MDMSVGRVGGENGLETSNLKRIHRRTEKSLREII